MGYESIFHLVNIKIREETLPMFEKNLKKRNKLADDEFRYFLERIRIDSGGFLVFEASDDGNDPYVPTEDDNTVPALFGKWYDGEKIASWLSQYATRGGRMVFHSAEGDGEAWGWEFDGKGRMRDLQLRPLGKWYESKVDPIVKTIFESS